MIINGKNTNKFKESSALGVEHYQNLISQPAKTTTKNTVSYEPVNISNFVKQIENEVSNKQTTTERIQSKMDKLWVDNTPNTSTVETSNTPQLRTTLAQQIKNGTAPSIQGKAKNNTLKQTANNVVKSVSEKVPVVNKYAQAYQTAKDNVAKVNAEIKASGLDFTDKEKQLLRSGNYSINYNYDPNEPNSLTNQKLKQNVILTPQDIYNNSNALGKAKIIARNVSDNVKKSVNTAFDLVGKGAAGVTQGLEGLADFGVASVGNSLSDLTSVRGLFPNKVSEGIRNKTENFVKKNLGMSEFVDEISEEKGGIYNPKILGVPVRNAVQEVARMFTTGVLGGLPTMMASAAGSSTEEALNEGENLSNAYKYGVISGAIEGATEKMFDAANLFGGGAVSKLSGKISRTFAGKVLEATAGEGVEEMVSQALNPFVKMITYKGETENPFGSWENFKNYLKDIGTAGYEGAIIGGFTLGMSAPGNVELQKSFSNDVYKAVDKLQGIDQVRKNEIANAIIEGTKSVTGEDIKNIRSFVENYKKTSGIQQQNAPSTISKENVTGLPKSSLYNSPTTQLQKPSNETISNQVKTAQNVNTGVTEQNSLKTVKTEPKTEEMSSKNKLNKKLFDERMELFDELVKKGYAEYKTVNKSTEMFRTDKWNNEADQIYKKIEKLFNEEYYPSTVTDSAKQSQAIASLPTQEEQVNDLPTQESVENVQQGNKISQFKSSENGRPYMNLNKEISTNNESKNNRTGLSEIESVINEIVPVRHGKFRQKAYGIYKNRGEIIRIKQKNDIPVALHELTHHLDKQLGLSKTGKFDSELIPIAVVSDSANIDTKRAEGVAEFGRYYMTDPEYAKSIAPTYFEAFEENLKQSPQMYAKVEQLQNMVSDYLRQSPLNRVLSHIDYGDEETNLFKRVKDKYSEFKKTFRKNFVDDLDPLKQVINDITDNKKLPVDKDAYARLRLNRGVTGKVQVALEYGIVNNQGQKVGKSLKEIIEPVSKNMDEFVAYISALRAKDLQARNERVETGFNARDIDEIIKLYGENKEFNKASEELYKFQNQIMQKTLVSSGIITPEALEAYNKSNPHYVPFYRVMDENFNQTKDSMSKKPKKIKGSTRDIINPLESIVKNVYSYYMIADKNNAYKFLFSLANEYDGTGKWFDKVPTDMSGEKITAQDVKGILDKLDVNKEDIDYNELFTTLFKPSNYQKGNIITVMDKGKPVHYEIMDKDLYKILAPSSSKNENIFAKILSGGSSALRVGATHTLEFTLRNPIKDTFDAFTYSKNKFRPVVDTVIGIFNVAGKSDLYYKWLESGGSGSSYTNAQRATLKNTLEGITPNFENKSIPQKIGKSVKSAVTHPLKTYLNLIGELSNVTEEGTRVGEFRRALQNNKTLKQAALESRDITVDFSRGGEHIKEANKYIAFLNANVQGLDKMFTAFKERPVATTIKGLLAFVIPSMLIAALSGDDRDKVPQWEKDSHWIFFIGNTPVRIPKPQGIGGAFSNLGESIVDYMRTKNPEVFNHFVLEVLQSYNPTSDIASVLPNTFQPIVENTANYSFFKEQPIVKQSLENRSPKYQYDEYTSTVAKKIGSTLNVSPKKIDNLISGYFGNLGKDVATLLGLPFDAYENATSGKKKTYTTTNATLKKIPLVKGFIASDYANPKLDKFYENKSQALTDYTDVKFKYADKLDADTITDKVIDSSRLNGKEKKELKQAKNINSLYNSAYNKIKDKNDEIDKIEQGKGSNQFKKVQIDKVNKEINKILEQVEKDVETYKKRGTLPTKDD